VVAADLVVVTGLRNKPLMQASALLGTKPLFRIFSCFRI